MQNKEPMITVDPATITFPASGGNSTHQIVSVYDSRISFKVKSSNNENYRVRPVYGFIEAKQKAKLEIVRLEGPAKDDKIVVICAEVPPEEIEPQAPFRGGFHQGEFTIQIKAT
ncbi:unnamed protein product [Caenorhabditis sp. 36 PRJEB53466]|nr:unnamed protein product [Caenorhabditis sp. 36 PRJEB53466]